MKKLSIIAAAIIAAFSVCGVASAHNTRAVRQAKAVKKWGLHYGTDLARLSIDFTAIHTAIDEMLSATPTNRTFQPIKLACEKLGSDVVRLQSDPPLPVASVETVVMTALQSFTKGSSLCVSGINAFTPQDIQDATSLVAAGDASFAQATARIKQIQRAAKR